MMFGPTMRRRLQDSPIRRSGLLRLSTLALLLGGLTCLPAEAQSARPDQAFRRNPRTLKTAPISGEITENSLDNVRLDQDGKEIKHPSLEIVKITWGEVPPSYRDGLKFSNRGDFANAVAKFRVAAGDASARSVVKASARFEAARALLASGSLDPNQYTECQAECDRFLSDYANNRNVPEVRRIRARATLLAGKPAEAGELYKALYAEGMNDPATTGYDRELCLDAGLSAAKAYLSAGDGLAARELFATLDPGYAGLIASLGDELATRAASLEGARAEVGVGEGFCLLASNQVPQAISFFEGKLGDRELASRAKFSANLGLAEALMLEGKTRRAQLEFAKVSAIDHTDRDRAARARVGLAGATLKLQDSDAALSAKKLLTDVRDNFGDTPAATMAAEMLQSL
jgi:hypothetical protein